MVTWLEFHQRSFANGIISQWNSWIINEDRKTLLGYSSIKPLNLISLIPFTPLSRIFAFLQFQFSSYSSFFRLIFNNLPFWSSHQLIRLKKSIESFIMWFFFFIFDVFYVFINLRNFCTGKWTKQDYWSGKLHFKREKTFDLLK